MISRIKLWRKHRHEKKLYVDFGTMLGRKDLIFEVKEVRTQCDNPFHYHTIPVVELQSPAYMANVYINMQTDARGKVIAVQVNFGYTVDDIHSHEEDAMYSIPREKLEGLLDTITDKLVVTWIQYRESLG